MKTIRSFEPGDRYRYVLDFTPAPGDHFASWSQ